MSEELKGEVGLSEYPQGLALAEMRLVRMLKERRSWADYMDIVDAIGNLHIHAKSMQEEHDHLCGGDQIDSGSAMPPRVNTNER